ncbi:unnamed protein product [Nyctereutes procyonoides]|uniref:Small ribosomal subunit protein eS6 n=1 Tax=Nyctereutes procyonoides TaxID=34880 RepID=A0A811Y5U6_NYCPR|nr:unnamed protein product [Nyctereutes procyonoides]
MKLNISFPATGCQKLIEVDDEHKLKLCTFYEKRMATEVAADALGEEWKGFPMKQGVLTHDCIHLLLKRKCQSVWGCIVDANLSVLNLVIVKKGENDIPELTDITVPQDDVHEYVRKPLNKEGKKPRTKAPKIQRLVTPYVLQHKRWHIALKKQHTEKNKEEAAEYAKLLEQIAKMQRLSSLRASASKSESSEK